MVEEEKKNLSYFIGTFFFWWSIFWMSTVGGGRRSSTVVGMNVKACHQEFVQDFAESGNFSSLNFPQRYPPNLECVYTFVAKPNNRIEMTFQEFDLETSIPRCEHYLDLYAEVEGTFDFLTEKLSGRFCGTVSPGMRISMFNVIVLVFHARGQKSGKGFRGAFKFVPADKYKLSPGKSCDVTIRSTESAEGSLFSPTYPGKYPSNLICNYKLLGRPGERIRLYFKDFDLYFGGQHCPYDSVTIYDGDSDNYPIIQKVCGLQQTLELYSRSAHLHLVFQSTDPPYSEHRGFEIVYSFNRTLVDIEKMLNKDPGAEYVRGTKCDIRVKSSGESTHFVRSPGFPSSYPKNVECTYILDGMQGRQKLEHVSIEFLSFNVISDSLDCSEANLSLYMTGPELRDARSDPQAERVTFCSPMDEPQLKSFYSSSASRMIMIFKSNESVGQGFEARVRFRTDFGIVGTKVAKNSELCHFEFKNDEENRERNSFNSPRFPDDYFSNTTCIYDIKAPENRRIYIEFEQFDLHQPYPPEENNAGGDRLEIFDAFKNNRTFRLYANYSSLWSGWVPGPTISRSNWVRVVFHSDARGTKTGFKAYYKFLPLRNDGQECETPVGPTLDEPKGTVTEHPVCADLRSGATAGSILSPNFGSKYDAGLDRLWIIKARKGYRVLLEPVVLKVEGKMKPDGTYGQCDKAVIRVYDDTDPSGKEFCGDVIKNPGVRQFVSSNETLYINFITSPYSVMGLDGFNFSWTEFRDDPLCNDPDHFKCSQNGFCIDRLLVCNQMPNCGYYDTSDEYKILYITVLISSAFDQVIGENCQSDLFLVCGRESFSRIDHGQQEKYVPSLWTRFFSADAKMPAAPKIHKNLKNRRPVSNGRQSTVDKSECSKSTIILKPKEQHVQIPTFSPGRKSTQAPADYGPTEESFKKTTTMTIVGLCSFSAFIAILVCLIARHRWKQKAKQRRASIDARYGSTVIKRHLNAASSSIRSRQLAGQPDFI